MATHSSILAWEIPWTEEPSSHSPCSCKELVGHNLATQQHTPVQNKKLKKKKEFWRTLGMDQRRAKGGDWGELYPSDRKFCCVCVLS